MSKSNALPSPCIGVCEFHRAGHCTGCSMTKEQKRIYKGLKQSDLQQAFLTMLLHQQTGLGGYDRWTAAYLKKLRKKDLTPPPVLERDPC